MFFDFSLFTEQNAGNPAANMGINVTLGANNADAAGGVTTLIGTPLTHAGELLELSMDNNFVAATNTQALLDIVMDKAGGTSWDLTNRLISSIPVGHLQSAQSAIGPSAPRRLSLPLAIPKGATIGAIGRTVAGADRTVAVNMTVWGGGRRPWIFPASPMIDTLGANRAASAGTGLTPNATANTFGNWTNIDGGGVGGVTLRDYRAIAVLFQAATSSIAGAEMELQIGVASAKIAPSIYFRFDSSSEIAGPPKGGFDGILKRSIAKGTQLMARVRGTASNSSVVDTVLFGIV